MYKFTAIILALVITAGCRSVGTDQAKQEILQAETAFNRMAADEGVANAFLAFAADSAVLNRGNTLIKGKTAIRNYFQDQTTKILSLQWSPEFVDVAASGDLGYTYGPYDYTGLTANGDTVKASGVFHTVWKRQDDGSWKYVYD